MKNKLIRIISAVIAVSVIFGTYGCKKSDKTGADDGSTNENIATSVFEYTSLNEKKKEVKAKGVVEYDKRGNYNIVRSKETLKEVIEADKEEAEKIKKHIDNYNIDEKQYNEIIEKAEEWVTFEYSYIVVNTTPTRIAFDRLSHKNIDGVVLNDYASVGSEVSIDSAQNAFILLEGMYDKSKYADETAVLKALKKMDINIEYIPVKSIDETISDYENPQFKKLPVTIAE